jgi:hypothetical protein
MDDKVNKKACKVDSSNDVNPDPQQEGEIPYPFNMYGEREKMDSYWSYAWLFPSS